MGSSIIYLLFGAIFSTLSLFLFWDYFGLVFHANRVFSSLSFFFLFLIIYCTFSLCRFGSLEIGPRANSRGV